jgi:predicted Zn-dependent peptidase
MLTTAAVLAAALLLPTPTGGGDGLSYPTESYRLENGLLVTLHPDHSLPQVVIDTWYWVGSKDEAPGRTGFAHLFEHLMFMGTERVPGNAFDVLMEGGGGSNNASTSEDRTNYYSEGPSGLLETLLWLDADRLEALGANMTQAKLDSQREVVRNERRQTSENTPYGKAELVLPGLLYPESHPYHHPVIGSHEDLEAATLEDVVAFFDAHYMTTNACLVVAGDFEPAEAKRLVQRTFGQLARRDPPAHRSAPPVSLAHEVREVVFDRVEFPKLILAWHSPAAFAPGDGELDLLAAVLSDGPSSRLVQKLVHEEKLAQEVQA